MRLSGYIRVSTNTQVEDGQGLDIQEEAIRKWAKTNRHHLIEVYRDEGISGTNGDRDGLEMALESIRFNGAEGLVVPSLDRLARSLTVQEAALQQVWGSDGTVFTVDTGEVLKDDPDDPMRTFIRQVLGAVNQMEAAMIRRRLSRGRERKAAAGGYIGGQIPYGWRNEKKELVKEDAEQEVITLTKAMRSEGKSLNFIGDYLNEEGIPSKRGGIWYPQTVKDMVD